MMGWGEKGRNEKTMTEVSIMLLKMSLPEIVALLSCFCCLSSLTDHRPRTGRK